MLLSAAAIYGVAGASAFGYANVAIDGARYTNPADVTSALGVQHGANLFTLRTDALVAALDRLPTIRAAHVSIALPGTIRIGLDEREPILVWATATGRFLVDGDGVLFATPDVAPAGSVAGLRTIVDERAASSGLAVGARLDPVVLDAATRLGSLTPADVGSAAPALDITVDDARGFALDSGSSGWTAVFGFYTPTLRTPDIIPGQVRFLRSLFGRIAESRIATIVLADPTNGTYTLKNGT